jgi:TATA-box binding protein (TBP) (component of TFIID and TFIIIB)
LVFASGKVVIAGLRDERLLEVAMKLLVKLGKTIAE